MTIASNDRRKPYAGNGVTTVFNGPRAFSASHIQVSLIEDATGVVTPKGGGDYTLTGLGRAQTIVTMNVAPPSGYTLLILRTVPYTQDTDITNQGAFLPEIHENAFDFQVMQAQQLADGITRSLRLADTANPIDTTLPEPQAARALAWTDAEDGLRNLSLPDAGTGIFEPGFSGAVSNRLIVDKLRELVSVRDFGVKGDGATDDLVKLQAAIDATAGTARLRFPAGTYRVSGALRFRTGSYFVFDGIDKTIIKLTDDAPSGANVMQPHAFDGSITDVTFEGGFTLDGNYNRNAGAIGQDRPGDSGFVLGGARNVSVIGGIKAVDCNLHGIDLCCGGEEEGGRLYYVSPTNEDEGYYPPNEAVGFYADVLYATNAGDDNITGHYARDVHIGKAISWDPGKRHSTPHASNCFEIDDGCRDWAVGSVTVSGGARGVAIKCHDPHPTPHNISIGPVAASRCHQGVSVNDEAWTSGPTRDTAHTVSIESVTVVRPEPVDGATITHSGIEVRSYRDVSIGPYIIEADGDETGLQSAVSITSGADGVVLGDGQITNWPYDSASDSATAAVNITASVGSISMGFLRARNCGWRGIVSGSPNKLRLAGAELTGASLSNSIAIRLATRPQASGSNIGPLSVTGYTSATSYDTGEVSTRGKSFNPGDMGCAGRLYAGSITSPAYHHIRAADLSTAGSEILRVEGGAVSVNFYDRGSGGSGGANGANACMKVGTMESTSRSINAGGTINQNGADYAEYMRVAEHLWGAVPPGALLGFRADGLLTDRWADVVGAVLVKSTRPGLVGGDAWGTEEAICALYGVEAPGDAPEGDGIDPEADAAALAAWEAKRATFMAAHETERAKWDRMALCGVVPVDVPATADDVGKFVVPVEGRGGSISASFVDAEDMTVATLAQAVGRVLRVEDGRPVVLVR